MTDISLPLDGHPATPRLQAFWATYHAITDVPIEHRLTIEDDAYTVHFGQVMITVSGEEAYYDIYAEDIVRGDLMSFDDVVEFVELLEG